MIQLDMHLMLEGVLIWGFHDFSVGIVMYEGVD
jgi:hypothetical protein